MTCGPRDLAEAREDLCVRCVGEVPRLANIGERHLPIPHTHCIGLFRIVGRKIGGERPERRSMHCEQRPQWGCMRVMYPRSCGCGRSSPGRRDGGTRPGCPTWYAEERIADSKRSTERRAQDTREACQSLRMGSAGGASADDLADRRQVEADDPILKKTRCRHVQQRLRWVPSRLLPLAICRLSGTCRTRSKPALSPIERTRSFWTRAILGEDW